MPGPPRFKYGGKSIETKFLSEISGSLLSDIRGWERPGVRFSLEFDGPSARWQPWRAAVDDDAGGHVARPRPP